MDGCLRLRHIKQMHTLLTISRLRAVHGYSKQLPILVQRQRMRPHRLLHAATKPHQIIMKHHAGIASKTMLGRILVIMPKPLQKNRIIRTLKQGPHCRAVGR